MSGLVPARSLNDLAYCPRRFALERMEGQWADSADTEDGRNVHRRVDRPTREGLPPAEDIDRPKVVRSVDLGDPTLGIIAKIDLVEAADGEVVPVEYKRGDAPDVLEGAWEPERVQVCAQVLLLRAHGYRCEHGVLYFAGSRTRVEVKITEELIARTLALVRQAQDMAEGGATPPPLVDSPKCPRCSLVGLCLPDETNALMGLTAEVRPIVPARDDALPLYVQTPGSSIGKTGDEIVVRTKDGEMGRARFVDTSQIVVLGAASLSTGLLAELAERGIPVGLHSSGGWYYGSFVPAGGFGAALRVAQHRVAGAPEGALRIAKRFVLGKLRNQRVLLRRNGVGVPAEALVRLAGLAADVPAAVTVEQLLGIEGMGARIYFEHFPLMLRKDLPFSMDGRNRRPPRDPVNALLSFAYACLTREVTHLLHRVGLDPHVGFMHVIRPGRPALALDLIEEFRPIIADSAVLTALNTGTVQADDFLIRSTGVSLKDGGRRRFIQVFERRLDELASHPTFKTRWSMRRTIEVQARLLARHLVGELPTYEPYRVR